MILLREGGVPLPDMCPALNPDTCCLSHSPPSCGPQAVDATQALDLCAEVLRCLQKRTASWLQLFQLTETGKSMET